MEDQVPVRWDDLLAKEAKDVAALERPSLSMISLKAGIMKYQDQPVPGNKMECVVIAAAFENQWFENAYDPNKRENPGCFALSVTGQEMIPDASSPKKQHDECDTCPQYQWGSDPKGGRGKACKQKRRLALLPASILKDTDKDKIKSVEMALMTIPVMSAKNWANYVNQVKNEYARPFWAVLTEVKVVPDARTQFKVEFRALGVVAEDYLSDLMARKLGAQDVLMTPYDYSGQDGEQEAPAKVSKAGKKY